MFLPLAESPQRKAKSEGNERDDWPKPSASDPQCKMQWMVSDAECE